MSNNLKKEQLIYKKKLKKYEKRDLWLSRIFLWIVVAVVMFPIVAVFAASLGSGENFSQAGRIFPEKISFDNYIKVLKETDFLIWVKNSMIICTTVAILQLIITTPAAYAFSRLKFYGRRKGLMSLLILQMFPTLMALPAILVVAYNFNFIDNIWAMIILFCGGSAYSVWLLKGFMDGIPKELDEAAYVDGANAFQVFIKVILPLSRSMLVVLFVFAFVGTFSEFVITSALMKDSATQTVATGLRQFVNNQFSTNWTQFAAAAIMSSLPVVIIASAAQKFMAKGLVSGAVKG